MSRPKKVKLFEANIGEFVRITDLHINGIMRRRLLDLGFVPGAIVKVLRKSPMGDPIAFRVCQTTIALRKEESINIEGELMEYE
jgi:ferrous iron transport protein A